MLTAVHKSRNTTPQRMQGWGEESYGNSSVRRWRLVCVRVLNKCEETLTAELVVSVLYTQDIRMTEKEFRWI
jgi:hypothetical protein